MALDTNNTVTEVLARAAAFRDPLPAEAPTQAPTPVEVPAEESSPADPWEMERTGIQWCDCGEDHELDRIDAEIDLEELGFFEGDLVPHLAVCAECQKMWNYVEVCEFFYDHVAYSAKKVNGEVAETYPYPVAVDIIGYFYKTWQGCPREVCEGGYDPLSDLAEGLDS